MPLRTLISKGQVSSIILWGPPGSGKTSIARIIATYTKSHFEQFSAVSAGVSDIRRIIKEADAIVIIGVRGTKSYGINCGACGFLSCDDFTKAGKRTGQDFDGPNCMMKTLDLGIALCSAVKIASILNADNRIYYRIGAAVQRLRYLPDASVIMGIPLSAAGKNPHFDRERK